MTSGFEEAAWLFNSHISNRACIRQDFNEAALLWRATRASKGPILEIGRRHGGSTVLLLMAGDARHITSIDLDPRHLPECDEYFRKPGIAQRLTLTIGNSWIPVPGSFGFMFVDGDHSYEGVKADICAQWNSLSQFEGVEPTIVFHDAVENTQAHNSGSTHKAGVQKVCNELIACGVAQMLEAAGSSLWMKKLGDLPESFRNTGSAEILECVKSLITELRNRRNVDANWHAFRSLAEMNRTAILTSFSSRWLISICDTFADHAEEVQSRNALLISLLFSMIRLSDTLYESQDIRTDRLTAISAGQLPLFDGLETLHLDKQDTCLNLAKRLTRSLERDQLLYDIYIELLSRSKSHDNLLTRFASRSMRPEWVFPKNALEISDNYGVR